MRPRGSFARVMSKKTIGFGLAMVVDIAGVKVLAEDDLPENLVLRSQG